MKAPSRFPCWGDHLQHLPEDAPTVAFIPAGEALVTLQYSRNTREWRERLQQKRRKRP